jgi:hypothetical protein
LEQSDVPPAALGDQRVEVFLVPIHIGLALEAEFLGDAVALEGSSSSSKPSGKSSIAPGVNSSWFRVIRAPISPR